MGCDGPVQCGSGPAEMFGGGVQQKRWAEMWYNGLVGMGRTESRNLFVGTKPEVHKTYPHLPKTTPSKKRILPEPRNSSSGLEPTARAH